MGRKLGLILALAAVALPLCAATPASISGFVRDSAGTPQMGALVAVFARRGFQEFTSYTDARGYFSVPDLGAGLYDVKVSAPSFLPTLREGVALRAGASMLLNLTLSTLGDAIKLIPSKQSTSVDDDWKWTLRSAANRPILRIKNGTPVVIANPNLQEPTKASVAFLSGSEGDNFGPSGEMSTNFAVQKSLFGSGTLRLNGDVGYGPGPAATVLRTSYSRMMPDGSRAEFAVTAHHFSFSPDPSLRDQTMDALTATAADTITLADVVEMQFGTEFQTVQFLGAVDEVKPFGRVDVHLSPDTVVEYQYATSVPNMRPSKGFDSAPADLTETNPRMSILGSNPVLEKGHHQEISLSRRMGATNLQVAVFDDQIRNTALTGVGDLGGEWGNVLSDLYSGTFAYTGADLKTAGVRLVVQRKLRKDLAATVDYAYGGVLALQGTPTDIASVRDLSRKDYRHAVAVKLAGDLPSTGTHCIVTYRWINGNALTPVDMFNVSAGQADPYFNIFIRQPIPWGTFLSGRMEALLDIRNLLAQGYLPMERGNVSPVYLVQSARSVRGGVAFVF
ncbi:MAG TPA: carboxypeptidase-like regulatory domain-containing protein [Terriglobales bacterium]|nr:carboxypeptidase-like regulatory domain-containing protein [Terriglobales bacterium]